MQSDSCHLSRLRLLLCCGSGKNYFLRPKSSADPSPQILFSKVAALVPSSAPRSQHLKLGEDHEMQEESVIREQRKLGPDVWCYRWWESGPTGNRAHRRIVLGTAEELRDLSTARQVPAGLMQEINATDIRMVRMSMTMAQLSDHFQQRELGRSNERISYSTKKAYQGYLNKWVVPRWGDYLL